MTAHGRTEYEQYAEEARRKWGDTQAYREFSEKTKGRTPEIFLGLGQMYEADSRMKENIDKAGGKGTAEFAERVIRCYAEAYQEKR
ncbi:MAG: TipAS antibiotic-recognition domain-containing protein [Lachnospiraceae bacterium]|nr:TipAS antibiotic-recognition domain-containing protein [Lachnospiraceae bacterium]